MESNRKTFDWSIDDSYGRLIAIVERDSDDKREQKINAKIKEGDKAFPQGFWYPFIRKNTLTGGVTGDQKGGKGKPHGTKKAEHKGKGRADSKGGQSKAGKNNGGAQLQR